MNTTVTWGAGYKMQVVATSSLRPNPWNPNQEPPEVFEKVKRSLQTNGMVEPIQVRENPVDGALEIINGEHRWRAHIDLGLDTIPVVNLGPIPDAQAKQLTIILNELRGAPDPLQLGALLKDLNTQIDIKDLALDLPLGEVEIDSLMKLGEPFQFAPMTAADTDDAPAAPAVDKTSLGGTRRFQLGPIKANIPQALHDALQTELTRSAIAVGTDNPEIVLRDVLSRLVDTAQATNDRAPNEAPAQEKPARKRKSKVQGAPQ